MGLAKETIWRVRCDGCGALTPSVLGPGADTMASAIRHAVDHERWYDTGPEGLFYCTECQVTPQ